MRPHRYAAPDVWQPTLLAGLFGAARLIVAPRRAWKVERRQWRQLRSYFVLRRLGILAYFHGYPETAIPPRYDDLLGLHQLIMDRRPAVVLEFGGGYSTIVIAAALQALSASGFQGRLFSVDESVSWQGIQRAHLPEALRPFVSFHHSVPRVTEWMGNTVTFHESLPVTHVNLVYIDAGDPQNASDAVVLEDTAPLDYAILVDGRKRLVAMLKRALKRKYTIGRGPNGKQTLFAPESR